MKKLGMYVYYLGLMVATTSIIGGAITQERSLALIVAYVGAAIGVFGGALYLFGDFYKSVTLLVQRSVVWKMLSWAALLGLAVYFLIVGVVQANRWYHPLLMALQFVALVVGALALFALLVRLTIGELVLRIMERIKK